VVVRTGALRIGLHASVELEGTLPPTRAVTGLTQQPVPTRLAVVVAPVVPRSVESRVAAGGCHLALDAGHRRRLVLVGEVGVVPCIAQLGAERDRNERFTAVLRIPSRPSYPLLQLLGELLLQVSGDPSYPAYTHLLTERRAQLFACGLHLLSVLRRLRRHLVCNLREMGTGSAREQGIAAPPLNSGTAASAPDLRNAQTPQATTSPPSSVHTAT
jgi:hypothetical protein